MSFFFGVFRCWFRFCSIWKNPSSFLLFVRIFLIS
jgi:hypothetical protein